MEANGNASKKFFIAKRLKKKNEYEDWDIIQPKFRLGKIGGTKYGLETKNS